MQKTQISLSDQHILIVDDNPSNILLIELILKENNVEHIYKALSSKEAFKILKTQAIDAILLDVMLPDINGIQACKIIRENPDYDTVPIIMVTAVDDNSTFRESFNAGADDFVPKPVNDVILLSRLKSQLEKQQIHKTLVEQSRFSAMDEVISMLAHQWRQPLSIINAIANTVRTKVQIGSIKGSEITAAFDKIENNTEELSEMINSFKTSFSSLESKSCTDIATTIHEVCKLHQEKIRGLQIELIQDINGFSPCMLIRQSLIQVTAHLLQNCFDSFERFEIKRPMIYIKLKEQKERLVLTISDNGNGIKEEDKPYIFEPYFSTKMEKNGKGLGLYFAKQLATKQLEGSLEITSELGATQAKVTIKKGELC